MMASADIPDPVGESRQRNDIRNDSHLPECPDSDDDWLANWWDAIPCICDRLRACEQRVQARYSKYLNADDEGSYAAGYREALDAAEAAVAAQHWTHRTPES